MLPTASAAVGFEVVEDDLCGAATLHTRADLIVRRSTAAQTFRFRIWGDLPLVMYSVLFEGADEAWDVVDEPPLIDQGVSQYRPVTDRLDALRLSEPQVTWEAVALRGRSDHRDNLVETTRGVLFGKETARLSGHLLHVMRWDHSAGLVAMKLAPPADEQINNLAGCDFSLSGGYLSICGSGVSRRDLADGPAETYLSAVGVTDGRPGSGERLFRDLMRRLAPPRLDPRGSLFANNWGGGGGVQVLSQSFVEQELRAAARVGLTHYQIDAGWHRGDARQLHVEQLEPRSTSEVSEHFWEVDHERFPGGLKDIAALAQDLNLSLGMWYCLDRADHYGGWRRDLRTLLNLWQTLGVVHFKIDGLSLGSRQAEQNVLELFAAVDRESGGEVRISLDVTGSQSRRLGVCYGTTHVRDYFLENRYTKNRTYWPHRTLRNLWQLARLIPTYRLEMEWLDTSRHGDVYGNHPLSPARFGTEYALATALFALPLAWMHLQHLPGDDAADVQRLLAAYLPHQYDMLRGEVDPIGEEPSGTAWTGFCSRHEPGNGYLLLFRELNDRRSCTLQLPGIAGVTAVELEPLAGRGDQQRVTLTSESYATFELAEQRSFALYRWRSA